MVFRVFSAFLSFFRRRVSHLKGRLMRQILAKIMTIFSYFGVRLIHADIRYIYIYMITLL